MEPILPQPTSPKTLPVSSTPMKRFFSHLPAWVEAFAAGMSRASAIISAMACSAVVIELPNGVFMTMIPAAVAAGVLAFFEAKPGRAATLQGFAGANTPRGGLGAAKRGRGGCGERG